MWVLFFTGLFGVLLKGTKVGTSRINSGAILGVINHPTYRLRMVSGDCEICRKSMRKIKIKKKW